MRTINDEYDISLAFQAIENELIDSMIRNMERHRVEEIAEQKQWSMWQTEQLKALEKYRRNNQKRFSKQFRYLNGRMGEIIRKSRQVGGMKQEKRILQAIRRGWKVNGKNKPQKQEMSAEFFKLNERKLDALLKATRKDMEKAETAVLRMANDKYRKVIFNAQVYANTGAGTYEQAVDMATKDFLAAGLNCVEYANGARHTLADYADMAIRTSAKRAYLQGEGEKRQEWGIATVIINKRTDACHLCMPFQGKVMIDDVWSGGSKKDGDYPLISTAIAAGLFHPRCRDIHTTYFPGISTADDTWTKAEVAQVEKQARQREKKQYAKRQAEKYQRMADGSLDPENKEKYQKKANKWKSFGKKFVDSERQFDIIKPNKIVSGHSGAPKKAMPKSVIDHIDKTGKVDKRTFYGDEGLKKKDIHTTNHNNPKLHPYGKHGEHAHDYEWDSEERLKNKTTRELTDKERKENGDIL